MLKENGRICVHERKFKQHYYTNQKLHDSVFLWETKNGIDCARTHNVIVINHFQMVF